MKRIIIPLIFLTSLAQAEVVAVADPYCEVPQTKTVVWSPLFQATWDEMNRYQGGKAEKLAGENPLMTRLDNFKWDAPSVFPKERWKTWAGPSTQEFLDVVNKEAAAMTGENKGPFRLLDPHPLNIAAFGLLDRTVEFEMPFHRSRRAPMAFGDQRTPVHFFGVKDHLSEGFRDHVKVLAFRPIDGSHALEISCKGADDRLILFRPSKAMKFDTACKWIREWRETHQTSKGSHDEWNDGFLHSGDEVQIPYITLENKTDFADELETGRYHGKPGDPWTITRAEQMTRFELTEKGAKARVEVSIEVQPLGLPPDPPIARKFIYNRPFFAFLWRENADWPYLGVWVGDTSAMKPMN